MTAPSLTPAPAVESPPFVQGNAVGATVTDLGILDVMERLLKASQHPDIVRIERYGPGLGPWGPTVAESKVKTISGVRVVHQSTATASLWEAIWPGETPVDPPAVMPPPRQNRAPRLLLLAHQLLEVAQPDQLRAWQLVTFPDLGHKQEQDGLPFGLSVVTVDGGRHLLRATATGSTEGLDWDTDPYTDYTIPEEVKTCLSGSSTAKTNPRPPVDAVFAGRS